MRYSMISARRSPMTTCFFTTSRKPASTAKCSVSRPLFVGNIRKQGLVSPATFIPLAEQNGTIVEIGEWTLRQARREAASWGLPLQISVNLSPVQFRFGDLAGLVHSILFETGLGPGRLELEITEGVLIRDPTTALSILRRLKSFGVRIAWREALVF